MPFMPSMEYVIKTIVSLAFCIACAVCIFVFSHTASPSSFEGYSVLFVGKETSTQQVESILQEAGCTAFIDENTLSLPLTSDMLSSSPAGGEGAMLLTKSFASMNTDYLDRRTGYFTDSNGEYSLYYIPLSEPIKTLSRLIKGQFRGGVAENRYKAIYAAAIAVVSVLLCAASKSAVFAIFPLLLALRSPSLTSALCALLLLCAAFAAKNLWGRPHSTKSVLFRGCVPVLSLAAAIVGVIGGMFVPAVACLLGSFFAMRLRYILKRAEESKHYFNPVPILIASKKGERHEGLSLAAGAAVCIALSFAGAGGALQQSKGTNEVRMSEGLPKVEDYCLWCWQCLTYPYIKAGSEAEDVVSFPTYKEEGGVITEEIKEMRRDERFASWCTDEIDDLPFGEVEHLMKARNEMSTSLFSPSDKVDIFPIVATSLVAFAAAGALCFARRRI